MDFIDRYVRDLNRLNLNSAKAPEDVNVEVDVEDNMEDYGADDAAHEIDHMMHSVDQPRNLYKVTLPIKLEYYIEAGEENEVKEVVANAARRDFASTFSEDNALEQAGPMPSLAHKFNVYYMGATIEDPKVEESADYASFEQVVTEDF